MAVRFKQATAAILITCSFALPLAVNAAEDGAAQAALPPIKNSATLDVPLSTLWDAWTTTQGTGTWLAPATEIDGRPGGVYRAIYTPTATRVIDRGNDGTVIALQKEAMLTITWMTPLHMQELKGNSTIVIAHFYSLGANKSRVDIVNTGYGQGPLWRQAYDYNVKGWDRILSALEYRFEEGPMDWAGRIEEFKKTGKFSYWREHKNKTDK